MPEQRLEPAKRYQILRRARVAFAGGGAAEEGWRRAIGDLDRGGHAGGTPALESRDPGQRVIRRPAAPEAQVPAVAPILIQDRENRRPLAGGEREEQLPLARFQIRAMKALHEPNERGAGALEKGERAVGDDEGGS